MAAAKSAQTWGSYLVFALVILASIALLIFAGLFIRHSYPTGSGATTPGNAPAAPTIAGRYAGYTTLQTGICSLGVHEFVMDVDEAGNARSDYGMKENKFLIGTIAPNGTVKLAFRENGQTILFNGKMQDGHITGTSSLNTDRTCNIYWDLSRN
ncbi:MAG TPA: hypothetical protein VGV37_15015 [Aliidongia sp.]|uniref:hypothetical protein n=1 Tax=Aliidongia sp. TaxID=1914230 RepID=UPI002DDD426B|nr:hypothetical protein [Aliidongia sp.]HEV2675854.1 hypothetical protein [Aliidongia sp.]